VLTQFSELYHDFSLRYWMIVVVSFVDDIGRTLLFPFFALYITQKFGVGMTQAGIMLGIFSLFGLIGSMISGALTDKFGRRRLILFGLVFGALSMLTFGLVSEFYVLYPIITIAGLFSSIARPARLAMVADILPEHQRREGFGILRVANNLAWIVGPTIGGFIAMRSFFALFASNAILGCVLAVIVYWLILETKPESPDGAKHESLAGAFAGYLIVARDFAFIAFLVICIVMMTVYQQMYNSLSVYLRDIHGIGTQGYAFLLTTSAITVVLFQLRISRAIKFHQAFVMMALGTFLYAIGFGMLGFVSTYLLFMVAVVTVTFGEMINMPTSQTLVVDFAPGVMRGRYMAIFDLTWSIPATLGPSAAGYILDNFNPNLLWYIGGVICGVSALSFYFLHVLLGRQNRFSSKPVETSERQMTI
jgi:MFS family permease